MQPPHISSSAQAFEVSEDPFDEDMSYEDWEAPVVVNFL